MKTKILSLFITIFLFNLSLIAQKEEGQFTIQINDLLKDNKTAVTILFDHGNFKINMKITDKKAGVLDMVFYQLKESTDLIFVKDTQKVRIPLDAIQKEKVFVGDAKISNKTETSLTISDGVYTALYTFSKNPVLFSHLPLSFQLNELFSILNKENIAEMPGKIEIVDKKKNPVRSFEFSEIEYKSIDDNIFNIQ